MRWVAEKQRKIDELERRKPIKHPSGHDKTQKNVFAKYPSEFCGAFFNKLLEDQLRRACVSIVSNIAEGYERGTTREFVRYLSIAKGSGGEVRAQLYIAKDQGYLDDQVFLELQDRVVQINRMISGLIRYLGGSGARGVTGDVTGAVDEASGWYLDNAPLDTEREPGLPDANLAP